MSCQVKKNLLWKGRVLLRSVVVAAVGSVGTMAADAATPLNQVMESALLNDPTLQVAAAQHRADSEIRPKARADLLPQLAAQVARSNNHTDQYNVATNGTRGPTSSTSYDSDSKSVSLRQALIKPRSWFTYLQSGVSINASDATLESARQQALDRVVTTFFDRLRLETEYLAAKAEAEASALRLKNVQGLYAAGRTSDVELRRAEADSAMAEASAFDSLTALQTASNELGRLTGLTWSVDNIQPFDWAGVAAKLVPVVEQKLANLSEPGVESHPEVMLRQFNYESAQWEIRKRQSDHAPTLDLVMSKSQGTSASDVSIGRYSNTTAIGIQLNIPIYSGGLVDAGVREGIALKDRAELDLKNSTQVVLNQRKSNRLSLQSNILSAKAGIDSVKANQLLIRQATLGISGGLKSRVDLMDAESQQARANATLARAVTGIVSYLSKYLLSLGQLDMNEFKGISDMFGAV